ncbi:MAG: hypothetical protein F6K00_08185 [Leptolyngbya sp. SIOISBB]|nr:hypothetical protein [Leptolyngbya sp. SIOISBB]
MKNPAFERFLRSLPDDVVASFNTYQLQSMSAALKQESRRHSVDLRVTIPILWKKFYLVLLVGPERRSIDRRKADRAKFPIWTVGNAFVLLMFIAVGFLVATGLWQLKLTAKDFLQPESIGDSHPVEIPFITTEQECVDSNRSWENGKCIDYEHDRRF